MTIVRTRHDLHLAAGEGGHGGVRGGVPHVHEQHVDRLVGELALQIPEYAVIQSRRHVLVQQTQTTHAGDLGGVVHRAALSVVPEGRNGNHNIRVASVLRRLLSQIAAVVKKDGSDVLRSQNTVLSIVENRNADMVILHRNQLERKLLHLFLDLGVTEILSEKTLHHVRSVFRI